MTDDEIREMLASGIHNMWAHWMKYLFSVTSLLPERPDGRFINHIYFERWWKQMKTPYADLTEREKESDREQADKLLALFEITEKKHG